jgi:hypothetical protein
VRTLIYIDPGVKGAIAWRVAHCPDVCVEDLPNITVFLKSKTKGGKRKERNRTDGAKLFDLMTLLSDGCEGLAIGIEALPNVFKTGRMSAMFQGMNYGIALTAAESVRLEFGETDVQVCDPAKVRAFHGIKGKGDDHDERKAANVVKAIEVYPHLESQILVPPQGRERTTQVKDGRADALLGLAYLIDQEEREG